MQKTSEREQRELKCVLTDDEHALRADAMARCELDIEVLEQQRKGLNGQMAELRTERARLAKVIDDREETRAVDCVWHEDIKTNSYRLVRQDTGEEVDVRPMQASDYQGALALEEANDNGDELMSVELVEVPAENMGELPPKRKRGSGSKSALKSGRKRGSSKASNGKSTRHAHV